MLSNELDELSKTDARGLVSDEFLRLHCSFRPQGSERVPSTPTLTAQYQRAFAAPLPNIDDSKLLSGFPSSSEDGKAAAPTTVATITRETRDRRHQYGIPLFSVPAQRIRM